jgi:two-component system NtrC family response regulator
LRERGEADVAELATRLLADLRRRMPTGPANISRDAIALLARHTWPGNIRELRNVLERAALIAGDVPDLKPEHLPRELQGNSQIARDEPLTELSVDAVTRRHVIRVLERFSGNRLQTAKALGVTRGTLYKWMHDWGLEAAGR